VTKKQETEENQIGIEIDTTPEEGEWFQYFKSHIDKETEKIVYHDPEPYARVKLRSAAPFREERIKKYKRRSEIVLNPKTHSMQRITSFQDPTPEEVIAEADDTYDYAIMEIEGFKDKRTKTELKCNRKTKVALRRNDIFRRFFDRCQEILDGNVEEEAKN